MALLLELFSPETLRNMSMQTYWLQHDPYMQVQITNTCMLSWEMSTEWSTCWPVTTKRKTCIRTRKHVYVNCIPPEHVM